MSITEERLSEIQRYVIYANDYKAKRIVADLLAEVHRLRGELARQERVAVSEEMRLRRKKAALLIELDATYRKHGEAGIEQHHLNAAKVDLTSALGGGDDA